MQNSEVTILVVDDEPELLEIFAIWMRREGYHVLTAANGAEALKILTSTNVDALISDIRMPVMDGLTLVRRIYDLKLHLRLRLWGREPKGCACAGCRSDAAEAAGAEASAGSASGQFEGARIAVA